MNSIKDLLQAVTNQDVEVHIFRSYDGSARLFFFKRTGDIVSKVGHEFSALDLTHLSAETIGAVVNGSIDEVGENHKAVLKMI